MENISREQLERMKEPFINFILGFPKAREAVENMAKGLADFFKSYSRKRYQMLGYPLGKSKRGFKKWQGKQLRNMRAEK